MNQTHELPKYHRHDRGRLVKRVCQQCKKAFAAPLANVSAGQYKFCSTTCFYESRRKQNGLWFDGIWYSKDAQGYFSNSFTSKKLHREIYKKEFGYIPKGYVVHHRDHNKSNNDIDNLELVKWGQHTARHSKGKKRPNIMAHRKRDRYGRFIAEP